MDAGKVVLLCLDTSSLRIKIKEFWLIKLTMLSIIKYFFLSLYIYIYIYIYICLYMFIYVSICFYMFLYVSICFSMFLFVYKHYLNQKYIESMWSISISEPWIWDRILNLLQQLLQTEVSIYNVRFLFLQYIFETINLYLECLVAFIFQINFIIQPPSNKWFDHCVWDLY